MAMALVGEGIRNHEIGRELGRSEAPVSLVKKAKTELGTGAGLGP